MGNIVKLLSLVYEKECNQQSKMLSNSLSEKKIKFIILLLLTFMGGSLVSFMYNAFLGKNNLYFWASVTVYLISLIILIKYSDKLSVENCNEDREVYYKKLNLLKNKMNTDFHVYSESKVKELICECDKVMDNLNLKNKVVDKIKEIWKGILAPIVGFLSALIVGVDNLSKGIDWSMLIFALTIIGLLIVFVFSILWGIEYFVNIMYKEEKRRIIQLKSALNDIYLKNYI